jgi:hypothetical protein
MKLLVFTEGTIIMHHEAVGLSREEIVRQIQERKNADMDYAAHVPIGTAVQKLDAWKRQGAEIAYLTSRTQPDQVEAIRTVLERSGFPKGELVYRRAGEQYKDVAERVLPDILIEDDCESIGGEAEMTYPHIKPVLKTRIKSIPVKEFGGISHLPDTISDLVRF